MSELIPENDLEIVDLRASRLKTLRKTSELNHLVLNALNANENNSNAWIAFSYLLELNGDEQRALQASRKAILLDNRSRNGYMRHGELRMQRNDYRKALVTFIKAHQIHEEVDSFSAIVRCCCLLEDWKTAEAFASKALIMFPSESENGSVSLALMGTALRKRSPIAAEGFLKKALEKDIENVDALNELVNMKIREDDFENAEKILFDYRKNRSKDFFYWMKMAEIYGMKKEFVTALEYINKALQIEPNNQNAKEMLSQIEALIRENDDSLFDSEEDFQF
ncbi:TPR Domain containing protein [Histomonas meleagridis]|uniref:TPR Domain containing protein n=1 Tax=Histomonas meleagridis TaxID=135588 RepID=UPI003559A2CB|nr:TPR Domain containing protein [Histomonas meleagridis]KAH0805855.1 TPR Domain containing protein [Histomonas meleagridis]